MIEEGIAAYLLSVSALTTLISNRLNPLEMPQGAGLPAISYQRISLPQAPYTHAGPACLLMPRFQFDCYGRTAKESRQVAQVLRTALDGYVGMMGTIDVAVAQVVSDRDAYEDEPRRFRASVDVTIQYYTGD